MNSHEERKKSEEAKAAHKAELLFKAESRRNKLLGLWAAERMGHADPDAYAAEIVAAVFLKPGLAHVHQKLHDDLQAAGKPASLTEIETKSLQLLIVAKEQVAAEN